MAKSNFISRISGASLLAMTHVFSPAVAQQSIMNDAPKHTEIENGGADTRLPGQLALAYTTENTSNAYDIMLNLAPYTILGDVNHILGYNEILMGDKDFLNAAVRNEQNCIATETPASMQDEKLEQLGNGEIEIDDYVHHLLIEKGFSFANGPNAEEDVQAFVDNARAFVNLLKSIMESGINLHFADPQNEDVYEAYKTKSEAIKLVTERKMGLVYDFIIDEFDIDMTAEELGKHYETTPIPEDVINAAKNYIGSDEYMTLYRTYFDAATAAKDNFQRVRLDDTKLAENIKSYGPQCIISYGAHHGANILSNPDLDELLGEEKTVRIYTYSTLDEYEANIEENGWPALGNDHPEIIYTLSDNILYIAEHYVSDFQEKLRTMNIDLAPAATSNSATPKLTP